MSCSMKISQVTTEGDSRKKVSTALNDKGKGFLLTQYFALTEYIRVFVFHIQTEIPCQKRKTFLIGSCLNGPLSMTFTKMFCVFSKYHF